MTQMLKDAISKFEEVLKIDPINHYTMWCLGNAHASCGFLAPEIEIARTDFDKAAECFQKAVNVDPNNEAYLKSLQCMAESAELHMRLHRQGIGEQTTLGSTKSSSAKVSKKKKSSDHKYDIFGWIILASIVAASVGMAKSHVPSPPPR
ncbi:hypothetical protein Syun_024491 [Stephania yunnanensis]|uniref:Mitochondrial import receptor subunit TOM20 n=1 Tax=Stephania yunnanensis TaxID=152371 RepID=A0AAP0I4K1_9MAGN